MRSQHWDIAEFVPLYTAIRFGYRLDTEICDLKLPLLAFPLYPIIGVFTGLLNIFRSACFRLI